MSATPTSPLLRSARTTPARASGYLSGCKQLHLASPFSRHSHKAQPYHWLWARCVSPGLASVSFANELFDTRGMRRPPKGSRSFHDSTHRVVKRSSCVKLQLGLVWCSSSRETIVNVNSREHLEPNCSCSPREASSCGWAEAQPRPHHTGTRPKQPLATSCWSMHRDFASGCR